MKIKDGYLLKNVAGNFVVVSTGDLDFDGLIQLNETGAFLWELLQCEKSTEELVSDMCAEYEITDDVAQKDVNLFVTKLKENGLIHE